MRLLLTRAIEDATRTRIMLESEGHQVTVSPVIAIETLTPVWPPGPWQGLVATSARAFAGLDREECAAHKTLPLYLVGQQTLQAACASGFNASSRVEPDAVSLLAGMRDLPASRFVYAAGTDRKSDLERGLASHGHELVVLETYRAKPVDTLTAEATAALTANAIDGVLHYSRRSAELFLRASADHAIERLAHICLSADVALPLRAAGCSVVVADAFDSAAMLRTIRTVGISRETL